MKTFDSFKFFSNFLSMFGAKNCGTVGKWLGYSELVWQKCVATSGAEICCRKMEKCDLSHARRCRRLENCHCMAASGCRNLDYWLARSVGRAFGLDDWPARCGRRAFGADHCHWPRTKGCRQDGDILSSIDMTFCHGAECHCTQAKTTRRIAACDNGMWAIPD